MKKLCKLPSQETIKLCLLYNELTGNFHWIKNKSRGPFKIGDIAGTIKQPNKAGTRYVSIGIDGKSYLAHRLAFVYMTGSCPRLIDHVDTDGTNNTWINLKESNHELNSLQSKFRSWSKSGKIGIFRKRSKWVALVGRNGIRKQIGTFDNIDDAEKARESYLKTHGLEVREYR